MELGQYLDEHDISVARFAAEIGVTVQAVHRYLNADRIPRPAIMVRIAAATHGLVTPNDFFEPAGAE
jgi:transcriptional regulator with XRE-family HTH domain